MLKSGSVDRGGSSPRVLHLTSEQEQVLEAQFEKVKNPHNSDLVLLAAETGLSETDVQMWYSRKLLEWRKKQGLSPNPGVTSPAE